MQHKVTVTCPLPQLLLVLLCDSSHQQHAIMPVIVRVEIHHADHIDQHDVTISHSPGPKVPGKWWCDGCNANISFDLYKIIDPDTIAEGWLPIWVDTDREVYECCKCHAYRKYGSDGIQFW